MPVFQYVAVDRQGRRFTGEMHDEDETAVAQRLRQSGHFAARIQGVAEAVAAPSVSRSFWGGRVGSHEVALLTRQLANLVRGGLPIAQALSTLTAHTENERLRQVLRDVRTRVEGGDSLSEALEGHPRVFSGLFVSMVRAGEVSGDLPAVLEWLAALTETDQARRAQVKAATAYPKLLVLAGSAAVVFLLVFMIPRFVVLFAEMEQTLPLPTQLLLALSGFLSRSGWILAVGGVAVWLGVNRYGATPEGRLVLDHLQLRLPLFGRLALRSAVGRLARTLATLVRGGVPILEALAVARGVLENEALSQAVDRARVRIREGIRFGEALRESGLFPPLLTQMIGVGEETGDLGGALVTVAATLEVEVDSQRKALLALLEPAIILVLGAAVAFIIMAMIWPLFELTPSVGG